MITTRDIAREIGVSHVTVAAALKNSRKCSEATRKKVLSAAKRMGWKANPLVSAFQQAVAAGRVHHSREKLAWVVDSLHPENLWQIAVAYRAAVKRAAQLGFSLDVFYLKDYGFSNGTKPEEAMESVLRVVRARGIRAVIIPMREHVRLSLVKSMAQEELVVLLLMDDGSPVRPMYDENPKELYHRLSVDSFSNAQNAMLQLHKSGYENIGLCISKWKNAATFGAVHGGYITADVAVKRSAPCLIDAVPPPTPQTPPPHFVKWLERGHFDAVLCGNNEVKTWLGQMGYRIPQDLGLAHFDLGPAEPDWSGVDSEIGPIGESAVDMVTAHLLRNETGTPRFTKVMNIEGIWVDGETTRTGVAVAPVGKRVRA